MNKLFNTINNLFESDSPVLTERGHKYLQPNPNYNPKADWQDPKRNTNQFINTDTGEEIEDYTADKIKKARIFYDVIKHLAPNGYRFDIQSGWHRDSLEVSLVSEADNKHTTIGEIEIEMNDDGTPKAVFRPSSSSLAELKLFGKRPRAKTIAKELADEMKFKLNDNNIDDFMIDNGEEIKKRLAKAKAETPNTQEEFVEKITKQINKLPSNALLKLMTKRESEENENTEGTELTEDVNAAREVIRKVEKYSPQWHAMVDLIAAHWVDEEGDRKEAIAKLDDPDWFDGLEATDIIALAKKASSKVEDEATKALGDDINDVDWEYVQDCNESEKLTEAWDESIPEWLKAAYLRNKGLPINSQTKVEKVDMPKDLTKFSKKCDDEGKLFIIRVGGTGFWYQDRRWRSLTDSSNFRSAEEMQYLIDRQDEGRVDAYVATNFAEANKAKNEKGKERRENREGGVYRRSEVPKSKSWYDSSYGFGFRSDDKYDKSGYLLNPNKYQDMLRKLNQEKLANSATIDKLKTEDYVNRFNELGKQAAQFIGNNLAITYTDGGKYSDFKIDTSVIERVKELASKASYEIRKLMRRIEYVKTGDKYKLDYFNSPEEDNVTNIDKWIKDQTKAVDQALKDFEKGVTDAKKETTKAKKESEELTETYTGNSELETALNNVWFDYCAALNSFKSAKEGLKAAVDKYDINEIRKWFEGTVSKECYSESSMHDAVNNVIDMKEEMAKINGTSDEATDVEEPTPEEEPATDKE